ncbi:hypothetical protein GCK72_025062 [Caenorhabditis remanei]|uniref:Uncharacterized protein n=1 Tax=Caenorhabditis remanei TaxID=31234 RepID=A0A6A5G1Q9_CAERE|nr:hypothetical protein GCK72_025062 [Caenorhabditis remanei]KAF1748595.1 hypothetical protein GCK72_025062 [Caenorhabditis remanei]
MKPHLLVLLFLVLLSSIQAFKSTRFVFNGTIECPKQPNWCYEIRLAAVHKGYGELITDHETCLKGETKGKYHIDEVQDWKEEYADFFAVSLIVIHNCGDEQKSLIARRFPKEKMSKRFFIRQVDFNLDTKVVIKKHIKV